MSRPPAGVEIEVFGLSEADMVAYQRGTPRVDLEQRIKQGLPRVKRIRAEPALPSPTPSPTPRFGPPASGTADLGGFSPRSYVARGGLGRAKAGVAVAADSIDRTSATVNAVFQGGNPSPR